MVRIIVIVARRPRFSLVYAPAVKQHLRAIALEHHAIIRRKIEEQLQFEPGVETRNRKPLHQPAALAATWEIRFGPANRLRVLYDIDPERRTVVILAIGERDGDRLLIGKEEVEL